MKNKIDINSSINKLNETSSFISRHIGSSDDQVNDCLGFLNYKSLDQLVMDTLPNQIVLDVDVDLKESMSEDEALKYLQSIVSKNKLYKNPMLSKSICVIRNRTLNLLYFFFLSYISIRFSSDTLLK